MVELDERGRVVLPSSLRAELGLQAGSPVGFERVEEGILVRPLHRPRELLPRLVGIVREDAPGPYEDPLGLKGIWG